MRNWNLLDKYLQDKHLFTKIEPTNRAQIIDDSLSLARGELIFIFRINKQINKKYVKRLIQMIMCHVCFQLEN